MEATLRYVERRPTRRFQKEKITDAKTQLRCREEAADGKSEIEKNEKTARRRPKEVRNNEATIASGDAKLRRGVESVGSKPWPTRESARVNRTEAVATFSRKKSRLEMQVPN